MPPSFEIGPSATESSVISVEEEIEQAIPVSFRNVLIGYSSEVRVEWEVPDDERKTLPEVLRQIWAGECRWSLESLPSLWTTYQEWLKAFTDPADKYDGPWQSKFPILEVGNGDIIAIDISQQHKQPVVYLSHEGDDTIHGYWLGRDFEDYVDRLTKLGCVGAEDWQLAPFVSGPRSFLDTEGANAKLWLDWFGINGG